MLPTRSSHVAVAALAFATLACNDYGLPQATNFSQQASFELYALTGAPARASTALSFTTGAQHADASFSFDVAVDLDSSGKVLVYPVRSIGGNLAGVLKRVGLQAVPGPFETVTAVPETGYDTLGFKTITPGTVLAVELQEPAICQYSLGGLLLHGKLVVDSVVTTTRRIYITSVIDPNCGYRQVRPDTIPDF